MKILTICMILFLFVSVAGAQDAQPNVDAQPSILEVRANQCEAKAVFHYTMSTDANQADKQDWNIKAAESYRQLSEMGYKEC